MKRILFAFTMIAMVSCNQSPKESKEDTKMVKLITVDPGHFHAALVQKKMYQQVDSVVHVYAPAGNDLSLHLDRITAFNARKDDPTRWKEEVYTGDDYLEKMLAEKKGNTVVLAGNNRKKTEYIARSLEAGFNVLADKPMVINSESFDKLQKAFATAKEKNLFLYDVMTERFEITTILQRELSMIPEIFGELSKGSPDKPAVIMESGHCFYKYISGNVLTRPAWFMDTSQQGQGIVDVTTHLVDLVQWECFPGQSLDYTKDIQVQTAKRWATNMTLSQFKTITKLDSFPSFLEVNKLNDTTVQVWSNGEINYRLLGVHAKVSVIWEYQAPGGSDTHYSFMQGTKANLVIKQGPEEQYKPTLYIEMPLAFKSINIAEAFKKIQVKYPGTELSQTKSGWKVVIPEKYKEGHEAHFGRIMENYLGYLENHSMPVWEVPNMLAKYYTTTKALEIAASSSNSSSKGEGAAQQNKTKP